MRKISVCQRNLNVMTGSVVQYAFTPAAIIMNVFNTGFSISVALLVL